MPSCATRSPTASGRIAARPISPAPELRSRRLDDLHGVPRVPRRLGLLDFERGGPPAIPTATKCYRYAASRNTPGGPFWRRHPTGRAVGCRETALIRGRRRRATQARPCFVSRETYM